MEVVSAIIPNIGNHISEPTLSPSPTMDVTVALELLSIFCCSKLANKVLQSPNEKKKIAIIAGSA